MNDQDRNDEQKSESDNRNSTKNNKLLYVVLVLLVAILIGFAWYVFVTHPKPESPVSQDSETTATQEETTTETTGSAENTTTVTNDDNADAAATNESGEINTVGTETDINGLKQTLTSAQVNQTFGTSTAPEGQTYMKVDWTINNTTNGELGFNPDNYVAYANGVQVQPVKVDDPTITPLTPATIQAGGTVTGSIVYQIPTTWSEVQIYSHINPTVNQEVEYRITSDQL